MFWKTYKPIYFVAKAAIVSFLLFGALSQFRQHGWNGIVAFNLLLASYFTASTFAILWMAKKRGLS